MKVHIIDGHALLAIPDVVHEDHLGNVFSTLTDMVVSRRSLLVGRTVIDVLERRDPNGRAFIWADSTIKGGHQARVSYEWKVRAQDAAQKAGFDAGMEDTLGGSSSGTVEVAALLLFWQSMGHEPTVVTEDWSDKPLRPALGQVCNRLAWPSCRLVPFLQDHGLGAFLT